MEVKKLYLNINLQYSYLGFFLSQEYFWGKLSEKSW